jgi:hypothetical protein
MQCLDQHGNGISSSGRSVVLASFANRWRVTWRFTTADAHIKAPAPLPFHSIESGTGRDRSTEKAATRQQWALRWGCNGPRVRAASQQRKPTKPRMPPAAGNSPTKRPSNRLLSDTHRGSQTWTKVSRRRFPFQPLIDKRATSMRLRAGQLDPWVKVTSWEALAKAHYKRRHTAAVTPKVMPRGRRSLSSRRGDGDRLVETTRQRRVRSNEQRGWD